MFQSKKPNSFRLRTDASRDTRCSRPLNTQLPRLIAERAIQYVIAMDGRTLVTANELLVEKLKHAHWQRI